LLFLTCIARTIYVADMASRRTTVVLTADDEKGLREASRKEGVSQSALIRRGIRSVIAPYVVRRRRPRLGWLKLSPAKVKEISTEEFGDRDS
jgi:hypothetical protein